MAKIYRSRYVPASQLPDKKGLLEVLLTPLTPLTVPSEVSKRMVKFGQEAIQGRFAPEHIGQSLLKSVTLGFMGERLPASEIIGTKNFWAGLGYEVLTDPLTYIGGLGAFSKIGILKKSIETTKIGIKIATKADDAAKATRLAKELAALEKGLVAVKAGKHTKILEKLPGIGVGKDVDRTLVRLNIPFTSKQLGNWDIGNLKNMEKLAEKIPFRMMPDMERIEAANMIKKLSGDVLRMEDELKLAEKSGTATLYSKINALKNKITKTRTQMDELEKRLGHGKWSIIPKGVATHVKSAINKFKQDPSDPQNRAIIEWLEGSEAQGRLALGSYKAALLDDFEQLKQAEKLEDIELSRRLVEGAEARFITGVDPEKLVAEASDKLAIQAHAARTKASEQMRKIAKKDLTPGEKNIEYAKTMDKMERKVAKYKKTEQMDLYKLDQAQHIWGNLTIPMQKMIMKYSDQIIDLGKLEKAHHIKINLMDPSKALNAYVRRLLTPEAKAFIKRDKYKADSLFEQLSVRFHKSAKDRHVLPDWSMLGANKELKKLGVVNFDFFKTDFVESMLTRNMEHVQAISRAKASKVFVELVGQKGKFRGSIEASKFYNRVGLDSARLPKDMHLPKAMVDDMLRIDSLMKNSVRAQRELGGFLKVAEYINRPYRVFLTTPFPPFHNRNMLSNWYLNAMAGIANPRWYLQAGRIQKKVRMWKAGKYTPNREELDLFEELHQYNAFTQHGFYDEMGHAGFQEGLKKWTGNAVDVETPLEPMWKLIEKLTSRTFTRIDPKWNPMMGRAWGRYIEENARVAHFLAKRKELGSIGAMRSMNKYLFDYGKLTEWEKNRMRPVFLFYTWMRKNIPLQLSSLFTNPRVAATYNKIVNTQPGELPRYLRASTAFPNPFGTGYIGSLGMPIEDLNMFNVADVDPLFVEQLGRLADKVASRSSPAVRIPYEFIAGRQAYTRKPVREIEGETRLGTLWEYAKAYGPVSRFQRVGEKIHDAGPRAKTASWWLDMMTGVRKYDVSRTRAQLDELRRRMVGIGKYRREGILVIPKRRFKEDKGVKRANKAVAKLVKKLQKEKQWGNK